MIPSNIDLDKITITFNRHACILSIKDTKNIIPKYFMIEMNSNGFKHELLSKRSGNEQGGVNKDDIRLCHLCIPNKIIQKKIL